MHVLDPAWEALKRASDAACTQAARAARRQIAHQLNQIFRRLRQYQGEGEWVSALLDAASGFAQSAAVFALRDGVLRLRAQTGLDLPSDLAFPASSAAAFAAAIESRDPVVALRSMAEVTAPLAVENPAARAHLFPIVNDSRVVAVLFAADDDFLDVNALELIGGMAATVIERQTNQSLHTQIAPILAAPKSSVPLPSWTQLSSDQRIWHIRAQRFARASVAEMHLARPEAGRAGRAGNNLYVLFRGEIDRARESYRKQFMTMPSMVDYLHLELVRTAAEGDESKLGVDYPGQLA